MKLHQLNNVKQTLSFFAITTAWALMNLLHSIHLGWTDGKASDSGVVIFWSGLFMTIAWAVFIIYPLKRLDHSKWWFDPIIFAFGTAVYGGLTFSVIVGGLFRSLDLVLMFMPLAMLSGLIFGITYSLLIRSEWLVELLYRKVLVRLLFYCTPAVFLLLFLWILPTLAPALAFRYMPDEIRYAIVARTIPQYKVGESFEPLKNALPGYLDHIGSSGNMAASMDGFAFVLQVHCNTIIRLEYGKTSSEYDATIYGKLHDSPCPQ